MGTLQRKKIPKTRLYSWNFIFVDEKISQILNKSQVHHFKEASRLYFHLVTFLKIKITHKYKTISHKFGSKNCVLVQEKAVTASW